MKISSLQKGLVGHWPLDIESLRGADGLTDKTPHSNHGVSANTPVFTTDRMGQSNRAMSFNGSTDSIDCGEDSSLILSNEFTLATWIYIASNPPVNKYPSIVGSALSDAFRLHHADISLQFRVGGVSLTQALTTLNFGEWYSAIITRDSSNNIKYYLNGVDDTNGNPTSSNTFLAELIGSRGLGNWFFNGSIADVRIYNRALSQDEITSLYEAYRPKLSMGSLMKGLVLDLPLTSEYTKSVTVGSEIMTDRTPYSNDGQNNGGDVDTDHTTFVAANSDYVRIPDSESLSPTSAMTAMIWVKGAAQSEKIILAHSDTTLNQRTFRLKSSNIAPYNNLNLYITDDGFGASGHRKFYYSSITVFDSTWHLAGFTFDEGTLKLFVDGVEDTNPTKTVDDAITTIHNSTADIMVGSYLDSDTPVNFFNGDIAEAKMWNRALSEAEVLLLFEKSKGKVL